MKDGSQYISGDDFHHTGKPIYSSNTDWAVYKKQEFMSKIIYDPSHHNLDYDDERRGVGKNFVTWVFSEQSDTKEGLSTSGLDAVLKSVMGPNVSLGYHIHDTTEEVYYVIEGSITVTTEDPKTNRTLTETLGVGDAHLIRKGQAHYATAGPHGVVFLAILVKA